MPLRVHFELSERDVSHLRGLLRSARDVARGCSDDQIWAAAHKLVDEVRAAQAPDYVLERVAVLETLMALLRDEDWKPPPSVHGRVRTVLAYFMDAQDLIPDDTPALGYLDDAIMIELLTQGLRHEIRGYREFAEWRDARPRDHDALLKRRRKLRARIQDGRNRESDGRRFGIF